MLERPSLELSKGLVAIPHGLAIIFTVFRLQDRIRFRRLWWDDFWAFLALLCDIPFFISFLLRSENASKANGMSLNARIAICWIGLILFPCALWCARISIAVSAIRITPPGVPIRIVAFYMSIVFGASCLANLCLRTWTCAHDSGWHRRASVQCFLGPPVGILMLATDVLADVLLVCVPLRMLWNIKLKPKNLRLMVIVVFASSVCTALASIVYVVFLFGPKRWGPGLGLLIAITAHVETGVAILVCNSLVVTSYFYRKLRHDPEADPSVTSGATTEVESAPNGNAWCDWNYFKGMRVPWRRAFRGPLQGPGSGPPITMTNGYTTGEPMTTELLFNHMSGLQTLSGFEMDSVAEKPSGPSRCAKDMHLDTASRSTNIQSGGQNGQGE